MLFLFELIIFSLIVYEYNYYKTILTPFVIIASIYCITLPMVNSLGVIIGFLPITDLTIVFFGIFLVIVFFSSRIVSSVYYCRKFNVCAVRCNPDNIKEKLLSKRKIIWLIYLFSLLCYLISLFQVIRIYGINNTKSHAFGIYAHIGFLSRCIFPIIAFYFFETKHMRYLIAILVNLVALIMFQGKYHLYIACASIPIFFIFLSQKIKVRKVLRVIVLLFFMAILLFVSVYTIIPNIIAGVYSASAMKEGLKFSFRHFFHYLFCPFICSNDYFSNPIYNGLLDGLRIQLNPFDRLYQQFIGNRDFFDPAINFWPIIEVNGLTGNVGGLFSESVFNIGYIRSVIYVIVIVIITYYFFIKLFCCGKYILTGITFLATFALSFFCNYFTLLPNIECFVYSFIIDYFILDLKIQDKKYFLGFTSCFFEKD